MFFSNIHKRMKIIIVVMIILFLIIIGRVFYIQVIDYKRLNKYATDLWSRNLPVGSDRGIIYDRNGVELANNVTNTSLIIIPNQVKNKEEVAKKLSEILSVDYKEMYRHISKKTSIEKVHPEGRNLSFEVADKINKLNYDGVYLIKESKRNYPYDKYLTGTDGSIKYFSDAKGNSLSMSQIYEQPQSGVNVTLTINYKLQEALERELNNAVSRYNPDQALGIMMNPNTGEILAIASKPDFSPSDYQKYSTEQINRNLPVWMTYEPGSTFKIITISASLEEKIVDLEKDKFYDSGSVTVGGAKLHCWKAGGHGEETYLEVVENSCNTGFVNLGLKLGKDKLFNYIDLFGFGKKTGVDLNGEAKGIIFNKDKIGDLELATTAFGQGVSVTPIHLTV